MGLDLAIQGGQKTISWEIGPYRSLGEEEARAAYEVVASGVLSGFLGEWGPGFYGGPHVKKFEEAVTEKFDVKHAVSFNSWTSGLTAALGAIGLEPGDEVIVSPFTMAASATAILHWNAIPVFADVDPRTYCIDPGSVQKLITPHTKAIVSVDIFGYPAATEQIMSLAEINGLKVISDTAQAPGATVGGRFAGTLTHIGGYSLNYHKHIQTGEGGVAVTDDATLAENMALIRNHAEAVVGKMGKADISNMVGFNMRLGEVEAAIGLIQLEKLERLVTRRQSLAERLSENLSGLAGIQLPAIERDRTHSYYVYPMTLASDQIPAPRSKIVEALRAEGVPGLGEGYQNIHRLPIFQKRIAYGSGGYPWASFPGRPANGYEKGICPVAERLYDQDFVSLALCSFDFSERDIDAVSESFYKVWGSLDNL